jgi:hypothetical protein
MPLAVNAPVRPVHDPTITKLAKFTPHGPKPTPTSHLRLRAYLVTGLSRVRAAIDTLIAGISCAASAAHTRMKTTVQSIHKLTTIPTTACFYPRCLPAYLHSCNATGLGRRSRANRRELRRYAQMPGDYSTQSQPRRQVAARTAHCAPEHLALYHPRLPIHLLSWLSRRSVYLRLTDALAED